MNRLIRVMTLALIALLAACKPSGQPPQRHADLFQNAATATETIPPSTRCPR